MEILISIVISTATGILKKVVAKLGQEMTKQIVAGVVFVLCVIGAYLYSKGVVTTALIQNTIKLFLLAVGYYEVVFKKLLLPIFNKLSK